MPHVCMHQFAILDLELLNLVSLVKNCEICCQFFYQTGGFFLVKLIKDNVELCFFERTCVVSLPVDPFDLRSFFCRNTVALAPCVSSMKMWVSRSKNVDPET
jgi:hypothetical protein